MQKPSGIQSPRDVLRWIGAQLHAQGIEPHAGLEVELAGMVARPTREFEGDERDVARYMAENDRTTAAIESLGWLKRGPFANVDSVVITHLGEEELRGLRAFAEGLSDAEELAGIALHDRAREHRANLRLKRAEAAAHGGRAGSKRLTFALQDVAEAELDRRRETLVAVAREIAERVGDRRLDAAEAKALEARMHEVLPAVVGDLIAPSPADHAIAPDALAQAAKRLSMAVRNVVARPPRGAIGSTEQRTEIHGPQLTVVGSGNNVQLNAAPSPDLVESIAELVTELRSEARLADMQGQLEELLELARAGSVPRSLWRRQLSELEKAAAVDGVLNFGARALSAYKTISDALGGSLG